MPRLGSLNHHAPKRFVIPKRYAATKPPTPPPGISIVTPSLDSARSIERTVRSVLDQSYPNLEYIVQDGGSTDGTVDIIKRYSDRLHHWESSPDAGQAAAINAGFRHATGEILAYLNADDVLLPGSLAYIARHFARHPQTDVVYGHRILLNENDLEIGRWVLPRHDDEVVRWVDFIPQETMFWRTRIWQRAGPLDESLLFALDWDLILRFHGARARFVRLPRFLGALRVHGDQKLQSLTDVGAAEADGIRRRIHGRHVTQAEMLSNVWPYLVKHVVLHRLYRLKLLRY